MNAEIKAQWVAALRSGKYEQTTERLCDDDGYCCLGVLADVVNPNAWRDCANPDIEGYGVKAWWGPDNTEHIADLASREIYDLLDLPCEIQDSLVKMNDEETLSFREIADWIEENL